MYRFIIKVVILTYISGLMSIIDICRPIFLIKVMRKRGLEFL